jgi:Fe-S-cluster-containing dehydrogenase component
MKKDKNKSQVEKKIKSCKKDERKSMQDSFSDNDLLSREDFLKLLSMGFWVSILPAFTSNCIKYHTPEEKLSKKYQFVFIVDITRCIGCGFCMQACRNENKVPNNYYRTWVENYLIIEKNGNEKIQIENVPEINPGLKKKKTKGRVLKTFNVPKLCNHCKITPCTQVCPVSASFRTPEGVVLVDKKICIGCGYCVQACPYGTRYLDPITHISDKCTWCYHRVVKGEKPVCVEVCPSKARQFGNRLDEDDPINDIFMDEILQVLKPEMGTRPTTQYIGLDQTVS